jgi:hypothetical protein
MMIFNRAMEQGNSKERESRLDELFQAYREACPIPEAGANFMPALWARIEAREVSTNWFGHFAKGLVTAALAASVILGLMVSSKNPSGNASSAFFNATFVDAWSAARVSTLEPLDIDRISYLETE